MIIDGRHIAREILEDTKKRLVLLPHPPVIRAITLAPTAATESYLRIKSARAEDAGMQLEVVQLAETATTDDVITAISKEGADACIVQLPLPASIDTRAVLDAIPADQDADVLSSTARGAFSEGKEGALLPPVTAAVAEILARTDIIAHGAEVAVIGRGWLVGEPIANWFTREGAHVSVLTRESENMKDVLQNADIIVSGAGSPHLITPDMVKKGAALIDAGTSESNGALAGDIDPACADTASVFTPVPGGVGPVAVACLFRNVAELVLCRHSQF